MLHDLISDLDFFFVRQEVDKQVPEIKDLFLLQVLQCRLLYICMFFVCFFPSGLWFGLVTHSKAFCREQTFISVCRVCHPLPAWEAEREHGVIL